MGASYISKDNQANNLSMQLIKPSNRLRQMISPFLKMIFSALNTYIKLSNRLWQMYQLKNSTENEQLLIHEYYDKSASNGNLTKVIFKCKIYSIFI